MEYEWKTDRRVYELHKVTKVPMTQDMAWDAHYPLGRLRKVKNKISCKKFALERYAHGRWEYITLLCMKLGEAKEIARTILIAGANDD
jgi:hypothetical protein